MVEKNALVTPTLGDLKLFVNKKYIKEFDLINFQRKFRKFFKFSKCGSSLFFMKSKITKHTLRVEILEDDRYLVKSSKNIRTFEFNAINDKEFIEKLIKHDLI